MAPRSTRVTPETEVRSPARSFLQSLDNYYAPARDRRKEQAFQDGINAFSGILGRKAAEAKEEQSQSEFTQGVQDALREQAGQELEGVRTGSIFRQHSKFYMAGLNETRGKAAAQRFKQETALAYQEWAGRHQDDDGTAFRQWMNGRVADFMGSLGDNQYAVAGALPVINEVATNFAAQHTGFTADRLQQESFAAYDEIVSGVFSDLSGGSIDMDTAVARLSAEANDMYTTDGAAANDRVVSAAIRYANIHNDPDAILAMAKAHDSGALKLSQVNRERLADAMDAVEADIQREASRGNAQATAEEKARREAALNQWGTSLAEDPYAELPTFAEVGDAQTYREMVALQETFIKGSTTENPAISNVERMQLEQDLYSASSPAEKLRVLNEYVRSNPSGLSAESIGRYTQEIFGTTNPGSLVNDATVSRYRDGFGRTLAEFQLGDGFDINRSSYLRTQGERHFNDYMLSQAGRVDASDPAALREAVKAAEEYAMEQLAFDFPEVLREKSEESPLGAQLGVEEALSTRDTAVAEEAARLYEGLANGEVPEEAPEAAEGALEAPEAAQEALPQDVAYDPANDLAATTDSEVIRDQPDSFYQEVLQRFIDGEDTRANVSPSVLVETAKRVLGANERDQAELLSQFMADGGVNLDPAQTAWCAGFMNAVLAQNGINGTGTLRARDFENWGEDASDDPQVGDIATFWRGSRNSGKGHVGFFMGYDANGNILVLGGNQGDAVSISAYPAGRSTGFRRPPGTSSRDPGNVRIARTLQRVGKDPQYLPVDPDAD